MQAIGCEINSVAHEIIEQSPSIAIRVTGENGAWVTEYITRNVSQYGYSREDFLSGKLRWADVVHPDDYKKLCDSIEEYGRHGIDRYNTHYRVVTADGRDVWVSDISTVVRGENGNLLYTDCIISDYTKIKENLDKIEDNARQQDVLNDILRSLHDSDLSQAFTIILDRTGKYLDISRVILFEDNPGHTGCSAIYEWCNEGIPSARKNGILELDYQKDIPEIEADLKAKGMRAVDYGDIPTQSTGEFEAEGAIAAAIFAVYKGGEHYGFICFDECVKKRHWEKSTLFFLQNISKLVSTAVIRKINADAIHASQVSMEMVLDNVPNYIYVMNPAKNEIMFANESFLRDFPGKGGDLLQSELHKSILAHCRACPDFDQQSIQGGTRYFELYFEDRGLWLGIRCSLIQWLDGRDMRLYSCQDVTEKKQHEEYISRIAFLDHLTGLPNRYRCDADLQEAINEARKTRQKGYILFIDMDDFKIVNDGYGHDYGDGLLIEFAHFLNGELGRGNRVFRFGGDEFVVMVEPSNAGNVQNVIDKLIQRAAQPWPALDKSFYCTLSIGVVQFPDGDMGVKEIIKNADVAMYEAKKNGKNKYVFYDDSMHNDSIERAEMEKMMRGAIAGGFQGFELYYQPYLSMPEQKIIGAEALLRWFAPSGNLLLPEDFLSLAEYLGLIIPIGEFVLRDVCKTLKYINDNIDPDFTLSVNMSPRQLQQQDILGSVEDILGETGANPHNLIFEITAESAAIDVDRILLICDALRKKGIRFAMDDFGVGYSSPGNMRNMPVDIIKIGPSFVRDVPADAYSDTFIRLITDLGHSLGKQICLEGVETAGQLDYCMQSRADSVQGVQLYQPMEAGDLFQTIQG